jgi:hypothetical protein
VPTRTYLTTPPGRTPTAATGRSASGARERYVPGLASPTEVDIPPRWRRPLLILVALLGLVLVAVAVVRTSAATQAEDPSLGPPPEAATGRP